MNSGDCPRKHSVFIYVKGARSYDTPLLHKGISFWANRAVFIWVSKDNWYCIICYTIGLKKLVPLFHPISSKNKTNRRSLALVFPRFAQGQLPVTTSRFDWFTVLIAVSQVVNGLSDYFGFGFTTLDWKLLEAKLFWSW